MFSSFLSKYIFRTNNEKTTLTDSLISSNYLYEPSRILSIKIWKVLVQKTFIEPYYDEDIALVGIKGSIGNNTNDQVLFTNCKRLFISNCGQKFVTSILTPINFPNVEEIYIDTCISGQNLFELWYEKDIRMLISPKAYIMNNKYSNDFNYIFNISDIQHKQIILNVKKCLSYQYSDIL